MIHLILFISWLRTLIWFYVFKGFRNWNNEQIEFIEKSFKPKNNRDKKLMDKIVRFNKNRIKI